MMAIENWNSHLFQTWRWPDPAAGWLGRKSITSTWLEVKQEKATKRRNLAAVKFKDTQIFYLVSTTCWKKVHWNLYKQLFVCTLWSKLYFVIIYSKAPSTEIWISRIFDTNWSFKTEYMRRKQSLSTCHR